MPTPCHKCPKIPTWAPEKSREHAVELSEKNLKAFLHYRGCRATGVFPEDAIVKRNAAIIRDVWDEFERLPTLQLLARLGGVK